MAHKIPVLLPVLVDRPFDYIHAEPLAPGTIVKVPFRNKETHGVVWPQASLPPKKEITYKPITEVCGQLPETSLRFIDWVSNYTLSPRGAVLKMVMPLVDTSYTTKAPLSADPILPVLSAEQQDAATTLQKALDQHTFKTFLLEGVTGSGKTEVYFEAIDHALKAGRASLVLLPEIALSTQWLQRFETRFGFAPSVWHSDLTPKQRKLTMSSILNGDTKVLVGTRSALFLPLANLALIIVDEEHDGSYKQEEGVIYNARDMALVRARLSQSMCILVSATPSLESETNAQTGKYVHVQLTSRYGGATMPGVTLIDMRKHKLPASHCLSPALRTALEETLQRGEQAMLFVNRRGYAPLTLCRNCGDRLMCPQCSINLVQHKAGNTLLCHHCGHTTPTPPACPACNAEDGLTLIGIGVERLHEEVQSFLPNARCALLTSDHLTTPKKMRDCLKAIQDHQVDVLIGTQLMAKGHHFPLLTLVGIVDGDSALSGSDLRAAEKSFQLLHQVAGRSGRASKSGRVLLQTYLPEHPLMAALVSHDRASFFALESEQRQLHGFPPYGRLVALILSGKKENEVEAMARHLARTFPVTEGSNLFGPAPAPLGYLRGQYRWRLLLKTPKTVAPQALLRQWLSTILVPSSIKMQIDIDPYSFF